MPSRRLTAGVLGIGFLVLVAARVALPEAPPLYDGVIPVDPYLWLNPPPGHPGGAQGATATIAVSGGKNVLTAVATPELEPQAQIFAQPGAFTLGSAARSILVSIQPVPNEGQPADGHVDGNVYRVLVTDQDGNPVTAPASARVSVVLRASDPTLAEATLARYADGVWQPLSTGPAGFGGSFVAVVTEFGDFAVVVAGPAPTNSNVPSGGPATSASTGADGSGQPPSHASAPAIVEPPAGGGTDALSSLGDTLLPAAAIVGLVALGAVWLVRRGRPGSGPRNRGWG